MAGRRRSAPGEKSATTQRTERVNKGREKIARARSKIEPDLPNEGPGKYDPAYADQAMKLCLLGYTNEQLAAYFEISYDKFQAWVREVPALKAAIRAGREEADMEVVNSLRQMALGKKVTVKKEKLTRDGNIVVVEEEVYVGANFNAAQLWLTNRHRDTWKIPTASGAGIPDPSSDEVVQTKIAKSQAQRIREALAEAEAASATANKK